jgi:hypothetical protein
VIQWHTSQRRDRDRKRKKERKRERERERERESPLTIVSIYGGTPHTEGSYDKLQDGSYPSNIWMKCVVVVATAKAGHPLSVAEQAAAVVADPEPYWLGFSLS